MNTVSSETRKYELKARAESQRETRERIAATAVSLHQEKGVAATTVSELARRAGVTRLTVYNHFPQLGDLLPACSAHYAKQHPAPDFDRAVDAADALRLLYEWYREVEPMFGKLFADRASVPELDELMKGNVDQIQAGLAARLAPGDPLVRLAVDFCTWRRLTLEGLADDEAASLMASVIAERLQQQ